MWTSPEFMIFIWKTGMAMVMACICNPHRWKHFKSDHNLDSFVHFYAGPTCVRCLVRMQMFVARGLLTKSVPSFPRTETQIVSWLKNELADLVNNRLLQFYTKVQSKSFFSFPTFLVQNVLRKGVSCLECKWAQVLSMDCIQGYCCWYWLLLIIFTSSLLKRKTVIRAIIGAT